MSSRERILHLLKTAGPQGAAALAKRLGVTAVAVRQHLDLLAEEGLVLHDDVRSGVGRPKRIWRLSPRADACFPDSHGELAVGMIDAARAAFGETGLHRLVKERTKRQLGLYRRRMPAKGAPLGERVAALAKIRDQEGYLAASSRGDGEEHLLVESHCPIGAAARACRALCDAELALFRSVLGDRATVERTEHVLTGGRRCAYRIVPRADRRILP